MTTRPSRKIYLREDDAQAWRDCESAYELGYLAAEADYAAGLPPMQASDHDSLWGAFSDYAEGYDDGYLQMTCLQRYLDATAND